ncbi:alpha/beta hydrolase [Alteribacillus sp. HJP-4]|uniref:alpha/beta hydrolase n=1 Tax=Alteribacillus sp. HJP-4 TaxID=2775394 RepID=UPI0035CCFB4E
MIGCLCLHGFTGSPWEVEPLANRLSRRKGWLVYTPVLPGHDDGEEITSATHQAWIYKADLAARELFLHCDKVYVIGFSMGGMLAAYIAARYPVERLVLLSAAAQYISPGQLMRDAGEIIESGLRGEMRKHPWYPIFSNKMKTPIKAVAEFYKAIREIQPFINRIEVPVFIGQGVQDGLVPRRSAEYLFKEISAPVKQLYFYEQSKHLLCHGINREQVLDDVEKFIFMEKLTTKKIFKSIEIGADAVRSLEERGKQHESSTT